MLKLTPTQESLHKVLHQLHLSSVNNADLSGAYNNFDPGMKFISDDCRGRSEAGYIQSGLLIESPHTGIISSPALEPGCYISQEHHEHNVWVVSDPFTYAQCNSAHRQRTPGQTAWVSKELSQSLCFISWTELSWSQWIDWPISCCHSRAAHSTAEQAKSGKARQEGRLPADNELGPLPSKIIKESCAQKGITDLVIETLHVFER